MQRPKMMKTQSFKISRTLSEILAFASEAQDFDDVTARDDPSDGQDLFDDGFSSGWIMQGAVLVNSSESLFNIDFCYND